MNFITLFLTAKAATISTAIPGDKLNSSTTSPGAFVANVYQFSLIIAGVLAFGVIVYGGIKYMTSAGNPSGASDAKEWVEAALLGLLLLAGAYFILKVINPQLVNLSLSPIKTLNTAAPATGGCGACGGTCQGTCAISGYMCLGGSANPAGNGFACIPPQTCPQGNVGPFCGGSSGGAGAGG